MAERTEHLEAVLLSAARPSQEQEKRFLAFLAEKYGEGTTLTWQKSDDYPGGFRLEVGAEVYDWSAGGRLSQFKDALEKLAATMPMVNNTTTRVPITPDAANIGSRSSGASGSATPCFCASIISSTPRREPFTVPTPPDSRVPPRTAAAIQVIS